MSNGKGEPHTPVSDEKSVKEHARIKKAQADYQKSLHLASDEPSQNTYDDDDDSSVSTTSTDKFGQKMVGKKNGKKPGGAVSYKDSYTDAVASKWESKGGYDAYEKAAKAWNKKKYGTTEPTSTAKAGGITKKELAKQYYDDSEILKKVNAETTVGATSKYTSVNKPHRPSTDTSNNASLGKTIGAANSSDSLLGGVKTRREKRRQRQDDRLDNRRQRQDDRQGLRSRKKWARGESKKSTTTGSTATGKSIQAESERNLKSGSDAIKKLHKKGKQILGSERPY